MQLLIIIFAGILGLIIGSFLSVVVWRMNTGKGIGGRSMCLSCGKTLVWYELIPLVSFIVQKGKCRTCHSPIPWQDPLVEFFSAILFAGVMARFIPLLLQGSVTMFACSIAFWFIFVSVGMVIAVYDTRHKIVHIPSLITFLVLCAIGGAFGGMAGSQFVVPSGTVSILPQVLGAIFVPLPFLLLWLLSQGRLMGFGDIEIMAGIGFLFGITSGYSAVTIAFWVGTIILCFFIFGHRIIKKKMHLNHQIPFAPFLLAGVYLVGIVGWDVFAIILGMR